MSALSGDLLRSACEPRCGLREMKSHVRSGGAMIRGSDHGDGGAAHLTPAKDAELRAQGVGRVDQDEGRPQCAARAVQMELDGPGGALGADLDRADTAEGRPQCAARAVQMELDGPVLALG